MSISNVAQIARELSQSERGALLALPFRDRGHLPDDVWWAFYALLDAGLSETDGNFAMTASPTGEAVLAILRADRNETPPSV